MTQITHSSIRRGFGLIELLLYVGLVSLFITGAVLFTWDILYERVATQQQRQLTQSLRLAAKRMSFDIRNAVSIQFLNPTSICLSSREGIYNPTYFYLDHGRIMVGWGGGSLDCTSLTYEEPLTSNRVRISKLQLSDLSSPGGETIQVLLSIHAQSQTFSQRREWQQDQSYTTSIELRSH